MQEISELERKEREAATLFEEATRIVQSAEAQLGGVPDDDDALVLELMARIRSMEEEIGHLRRHHEDGAHA